MTYLILSIRLPGQLCLTILKAAIALGPDDPLTEFELGDGLSLVVDPGSGEYRLRFFNDSLLLTKAAKIFEFSAGYSRLAFGNDRGKLYWGIKAKAYRVGLAQVDTRFGDLSDSEALFDDIKDAEFNYDNALSLDVGAVWVGKNYTVGASVNDLFEPDFDFPAIDFTRYRDQQVLRQLRKERVYQMDRQVRLQAGYFSEKGRWTVNMGLDANDIQDPMGDEYQWFTVSAGYNTQKWWLPGARIGYRENLSGTGLKYISAGITLFKYVDLDIAATLDSVDIDGKSLPRGANLSLGFEIVF